MPYSFWTTPSSSGSGSASTTLTVEAFTTADTLAADESALIGTNEGAVGVASGRAITLPAAIEGLNFRFVDVNGNGIRIICAAGDTIRIGDQVSIAGGYIESTLQGCRLDLVCVNATEWYGMVEDIWGLETS